MKGGEGRVKAEQYLDGNHQLIITKVALLQSALERIFILFKRDIICEN